MGQELSQPSEREPAPPAAEPAVTGMNAESTGPVLSAVPDADQEPAQLADFSAPGAVPGASGRHGRPAGEATGGPDGQATGDPDGQATDGPDGPLLGDMEDLEANWQRILAGFVDDPREAVAAASSLIEQTAQALASALRQRQQKLRATWDRGSGTEVSDTEQLRQMIRQYKALFNQISRL